MNNIVSHLADEWASCGIDEGDTLLIHSSITRTLRRIISLGGQANPNIVIASLLKALGPSGTLLLPLFNFDFTKGVPFDIRHSPSHMGALTEAGRSWLGAVRTGHPIYSFAVIGKQADRFDGLENFSAYGQDSPFGILHREKGKIGVIDLPDQRSMTFYHYVEEAHSVDYRYHKEFTGPYTSKDGIETQKTFGIFVRNIELGVRTHVDPMGEILWGKNIYKGHRPKQGCGLRTILASDLFDEVASVIKENRALGTLYTIEKD